MATLALPQGATKALATPKGKVYALGGAAAVVVLAYLLLGGGGDDTVTRPASTPAVTAPAPTTAAPAAPSVTVPFEVSTRNPFTKGDGSLPQVNGG